MSTDTKSLNAEVAEKIMGWRKVNVNAYRDENEDMRYCWSPSTDLSQAHEVAKAAVEKAGLAAYHAALADLGMTGVSFTELETTELATCWCRAALLAVGSQK